MNYSELIQLSYNPIFEDTAGPGESSNDDATEESRERRPRVLTNQVRKEQIEDLGSRARAAEWHRLVFGGGAQAGTLSPGPEQCRERSPGGVQVAEGDVRRKSEVRHG